MPHSKKVLGSNPGQDVSVQSLHVLPVSARFSLGTQVSSHAPKINETGGRLIGRSKITPRCECGWLLSAL